jgi:DNA end-binding protein Ku
MPRSLWSGAISFGLVNVPVRLHTAVRHQDIRFHQLHAPDGSRIKQKRFCAVEDVEVPYDEIVKGYEIGPGQYVMIDPAELEALDPEATHSIDIEDFVDLVDIDPLYYDSSYYVMPDERGAKSYRLLVQAMNEAGKVGIARVVMRTKQYLAALRPVDDILVLSTMNYADEISPVEELGELPGSSDNVSDRELKMAQQLIESLSTKFDPTAYRDEYRDQVVEMIERKAEGEEVVTQPVEGEGPAPVVDLMAALEASLEAAKKGRSAKADDDDETESKPARRKKAS